MFTSLLLALTWTPTLSQYFIRPSTSSLQGETGNAKKQKSMTVDAEEAELTGRFLRVLAFYERWLRLRSTVPDGSRIFSVVLIVASFLCYRALGTDLLPEMDEGGFVLDYITPAGTSLQETNRIVGHLEQMIREIPEVEGSSRRTGLQLGLAAVTEANTGDIAVKLKSNRSRSSDDVISELRAKIAKKEPGWMWSSCRFCRT